MTCSTVELKEGQNKAIKAFRKNLNPVLGNDPYFNGQVNEAVHFYILLAKLRYGHLTTIKHIQQMFMDPRYLADVVEHLRQTINEVKDWGEVDELLQLEETERIVSYFEKHILVYKYMYSLISPENKFKFPLLYPDDHKYAGRPMVENAKDKYITGINAYLNQLDEQSLNLLATQMGLHNEEKTLDKE